MTIKKGDRFLIHTVIEVWDDDANESQKRPVYEAVVAKGGESSSGMVSICNEGQPNTTKLARADQLQPNPFPPFKKVAKKSKKAPNKK